MDKKEQIRQGLANIAAKHGPLVTLLAQVVSVDEAAFTCTCIDDDVELYDVRLRPVINGNESFTMYPAVDSWVLLLRVEDEQEWQVISCDAVDKIRFVVGESSYEITDGGHVIKRAGDTLWDGLKLLFESLEVIMVLQGNNPDFVKLANAKAMVKNILNGS